jgi:hypothetical protein
MFALSDQYGNPQTASVSQVNKAYRRMRSTYIFFKTNEPTKITAYIASETKLLTRLILDNHIEICGPDEYKLTQTEMEK